MFTASAGVAVSRERQDLIDAVAALCERYPHWRLGQLVANVAGWADADVWDAEDGQLLAAATAHLDQRPAAEAGPAARHSA